MTRPDSALFVLAIFLIIYILPLGVRPMFVPDETRYAEIPREMIASGDWVVPHLNGLRYFEKPVLGYWINAAAMIIFGENAFAVRLPSALCAGLTALLIFFLARSRQDPASGPLSALIFLTCFEAAGVGTFAVLDTMLSFFLTGAMFFFFFALSARPGSWRERGLLSGAGLFCGLAFMVKGFLAFAVPALAMGGCLIWQRRFSDLIRMAWLPLGVAILVALPWGVMIHLREPDFWRFFVVNEHIRRFLGDNAQHKESFWFFFLTAPAMFLPWTFLLPAVVSGLKKGDETTQARPGLLRFSLCWFVLPFLFFSASSGKLLTYILPCFPPFALLAAMGLSRYLRGKNIRLFQRGAYGAAVFCGTLLPVFIGVQLFGFNDFRPYGQTWKWLAAANSLLAMFLLFIIAARGREKNLKLFSFAAAPILLFFSLQFIMPDLTLTVKAPGAFFTRHIHDVTPETIIISDEEPVRAVCWTFKRDDVFLLEGSGELKYGIRREENGRRLLTSAQANSLIKQNRGRIVLVLRSKDYERRKESLPAPAAIDSSGPDGYVFVKF